MPPGLGHDLLVGLDLFQNGARARGGVGAAAAAANADAQHDGVAIAARGNRAALELPWKKSAASTGVSCPARTVTQSALTTCHLSLQLGVKGALDVDACTDMSSILPHSHTTLRSCRPLSSLPPLAPVASTHVAQRAKSLCGDLIESNYELGV